MDGVSVVTREYLSKDKVGRLADNPASIVGGLQGELWLPGFFWKGYDAVIDWIWGKKEEKKETPGPFPENGGKGGKMPYATDYLDKERLGEIRYRFKKAEAESTGSRVKEKTYSDIRKRWGHAQGYEVPMPGGHEIGVMYIDKDGNRVSAWQMLDTLNHEIVGREYERRGLSHEAHEKEIHAEGKRRTMRDRELARFYSPHLN